MPTLTIHPVSEDQEIAIRIFPDALHVDYKTGDDVDNTAYLLSSDANAEYLKKSIKQGQDIEVVKPGLDDISKL
jgi:hypothetical protein